MPTRQLPLASSAASAEAFSQRDAILVRRHKPSALQGGLTGRSNALPESARRVLFVVSEMADYVKAGGLGDVAAALPRALRDRADMRVLIPGYSEVLARTGPIQVVGQTEAHAALPACVIGHTVLSMACRCMC